MKTLTPVLLAFAITGCCVCGPYVHEDVKVIPLKHASADAVVRKLAVEFKHPNSTLSEMAADSRTNSIVAKGMEADLDRLEFRIRELDVQQF